MRLASILAVTACLLGCVATGTEKPSAVAQTPTAWNVSQSVDRLTGQTSTSMVTTGRAKYSNYLPGGFSGLSVYCEDKSPTPMIAFDFPVGRNGISHVAYRFDNNPPKQPIADFISTQSFVIRNAFDRQEFIRELRNANGLYVRVISTIPSMAETDIPVMGAQRPLGLVMGSC